MLQDSSRSSSGHRSICILRSGLKALLALRHRANSNTLRYHRQVFRSVILSQCIITLYLQFESC